MCVFCGVELDVQEVLKQVDDAQLKIDQLCEQASDEILAVERRYVKLRQPLYEVCPNVICLCVHCARYACSTVATLTVACTCAL